MGRIGLKAYAEEVAAAGRNGDTELAHLSPDEVDILLSLQDVHGIEPSINPETGLPEFFSLGKILKGVAKAAGAIAGGYFGGPVGSAVGAGAVSKLLGDSTSKALSTGLLAGLGSWGAQQTGIGDIVGGGFSSGANLIGQQAADAGIQTASAMADGVASSGSGIGLSSILPALGIGAAALGAGAAKPPKSDDVDMPDEPAFEEYEPLDREQLAYAGDPYSYGVFGPEFQYFDEVNPGIQPMRDGGRVGYKYGGNVSEGGKTQGEKDRGGQGPKGGDRDSTKGIGRGSFGDSGLGRETASYGGSRDYGGGAANPDRGGAQASGMSATAADKKIMDRYLSRPEERINDERSYWDAVRNLGRASNDYNNRGQGFLDDPLGAIGRALGSTLGIGEIDPTTQPLGARTQKPEASWGIDPIGAALGLAGWGGMLPFGVGGLYQAGKAITGYQGPMISFDDYPTLTDWTGNSVLDDVAGFIGTGDGTGQPAGAPQGGGTGQGNFGAISQPQPIKSLTQAADAQTGKIRDKAITDRSRDNEESPTGRTYIPLSDIYNYGVFGPEHQFFTGEIPMQDVNMRSGGDVRGPGDGQSDDIPAMLSNGEYVIDAETVSALGDGSTDAGAAKLDEFRKRIRTHKRKVAASKIPPKAKSISEYMRSAA